MNRHAISSILECHSSQDFYNQMELLHSNQDSYSSEFVLLAMYLKSHMNRRWANQIFEFEVKYHGSKLEAHKCIKSNLGTNDISENFYKLLDNQQFILVRLMTWLHQTLHHKVSISSTFYTRLFHKYFFTKKLQSQNVATEKLRKALLYINTCIKC